MKNKTVYFFINTLSSGGAEHQMTILANNLIKKNYDIGIITFGDIEDHYKLNKNIKRIRLAPNKNKYIKYCAICKTLFKIEADCLIIFDQKNSFIALPSLFFRRRKSIEVICGERNFTIGKSSFVEETLIKFLYKRADYIVSNNYSQMNHIASLAPNLIPKLKTIINYTDINEYCVHPLVQDETIKIGIFARYAPQKNCIRFCNAVKMAAQQSNRLFEFHWYGNYKTSQGNDTPLYTEFKNKIKELKLEKYIFLHGHVKDTASEINKMNAIMLPSLHEGFSNSLSEAISSGKVVIASNVSDNPLMVKDGVNGYLFDPIDEKAMSDSILKLLSLNQDDITSMGANSRMIAENLFNLETFIHSYEDLII